MTAIEFSDARRRLGLTQHALALALQISTAGTVYRYESGRRPIPGPVAVALQMMLEKSRRENNA